ncbi:PAS domain S-box protein [Mariprofundus erugo]|uniref:histidine kinase n=1 Tax=Mariprofundus erugo TaxID=2528639 RepID=A0A5R9GY38_9PROT|nr:PAS domain S-box protein [Mariprofundus erugo]
MEGSVTKGLSTGTCASVCFQEGRIYPLLGVGLGIAVWFIDAFIDRFIFSGDSYMGSLLSAEPVELYMRTSATILFSLFGFLVQYMVRRQHQLEYAVHVGSAELERSEQKFRMLVEASSDWIWEMDAGGHFIYCSPRVQEMLGYAPEELIGRNHVELLSSDQVNLVDGDFSCMAHPVSHRQEGVLLHKSGKRVSVERSYVAVLDQGGERCGYRGVDRDITQRKERERALRKSDARLVSIIEQNEDAIISVDAHGCIIVFNHAAEKMFGYSRAEMIGEPVEMLIPVRFREAHRRGMALFLRNPGEGVSGRFSRIYGLCKGGHETQLDLTISRQRLDDEVIITAVMRDVSMQVRAEEVYRMLSKSVEAAGEVVLITDSHGMIEYVNPAFTRVTGYEAAEVIGEKPSILKSDAQDPKFYRDMWQTITRGDVWRGTMVDRRKDGSYYPALMTVSPIHNDQGEISHFVSLQQDMTEYRRLEEQFLQAQKMEAIGTLVGGIAHDFNNMLAAIQGNLYLARIRLHKGDNSNADERIASVERLATSAAEMIRQLLTFARKDQVSMKPIPLNAFIKEGLKLVQSAIPENISLLREFSAEQMLVNGDATQLQQVLMNLLNNARDAVEHCDQPEIAIGLSRVVPDPDFLHRHPEITAAELAHLSVRDNGVGIPPELIDKVVEPFFTTKHIGKGTGLGLAMVYGAVQTHLGVLEIDSVPGQGTTMHVYLPVLQDSASHGKDEVAEVLAGNGELILLVDDEVEMRDTIGEVLRDFGYRVIEAANGMEALQCYNTHIAEIALVISDVVMPVMGGVDLMQSIRKQDTDVPLILLTGYDFADRRGEIAAIDGCRLIAKPVAIAELSQAVHRMLYPCHPAD